MPPVTCDARWPARVAAGRVQPVGRAGMPLLALVAILLIFTLPAFGLLAAEPLLIVRSVSRPVDAIIVLGGDGPRRAQRAASLYRAGVAPRVIIAGDGDCTFIRQMMIDFAVPPAAIAMECASRNTWENAAFAAPLLAAAEVRSAVIVTSWFHSRRAVACFREVAPHIDFRSLPVEPELPFWRVAEDPDSGRVLLEYVKIAWYVLRYGIDATGPRSPGGEAIS